MSFARRIGLAALLLACGQAFASEQGGQPLRITPTTDCQKNVCRPGLLVQGGFDRRGALVPMFKQAFANAAFPPKVVVFDSFGGNVSDAINLGHLLRQMKLDTHLRRGDDCQSACLYAFVGGIRRSVSEGSYLGVHRHKPTPPENNAQDAQVLVRDITLDLMLSQVDRDILVFILSNDKVFEITTECARTLNVDNSTPAKVGGAGCGEVVMVQP